MRVGLTYDLRSEYLARGFGDEETAELDREDTIEGLESAIGSFGHEVDRIGSAERLIQRLAAGDRWDLVFNIAEGFFGEARESQVPAILDVFRVPYTFSDPLVLAVCLDKGLAKHVVAAAGVRTPEFAVVRSPAEVARVRIEPPMFVKPIAEGTSKGISAKSLVARSEDLAAACEDLLHRFRQPVLVERFLPGREWTVGIVGTGDRAEAIGAMEVMILSGAEQGAYSYKNKKDWIGKIDYAMATESDPTGMEAIRTALAAWRALGCRDGGRVDIRADEHGRPAFIEANPLAGLNPEISDLSILAGKVGITYRDLIGRILDSARRRCGS
jgi:D-alanine-D-alanine ligase